MAMQPHYRSVHELKVGMVLAQPLLTSRGGYLEETLPEGHVLTQNSLDKLLHSHAEAVCVLDEDQRSPGQVQADREAARQRLHEIFRQANLQDPTTHALFEALLAHKTA